MHRTLCPSSVMGSNPTIRDPGPFNSPVNSEIGEINLHRTSIVINNSAGVDDLTRTAAIIFCLIYAVLTQGSAVK